MASLENARREIDAIDAAMAELFCRRMRAVEEVIAFKRDNNLPVYDAQRENAVLEKNIARLPERTYAPYYAQFLRHTMALSRQYQSAPRYEGEVGYFGDPGSHTHAAAMAMYNGAQGKSYLTNEEMIAAVDAGELAYAVLPFENAYTGDVGNIIDLLYAHDVHIVRMADMRVDQSLVGLPCAKRGDIARVYSHPQALLQCKKYLDAIGCAQIATASTSCAAKQVASMADSTCAAIASGATAREVGLCVLAQNISNQSDNSTRFIGIAKSAALVGERFSLLFTLHHKAGQLARVMQIVSELSLNLETIKSRPLQNEPWQYYFFMEVQGDLSGVLAQELLARLEEICTHVKVMGAYSLERVQGEKL